MLDSKDAGHRWFGVTRYIRVPKFSGNASDFVVPMHHQYFRMFRVFRCGGMNMKFTKTPTERLVLLKREFLFAKKQH